MLHKTEKKERRTVEEYIAEAKRAIKRGEALLSSIAAVEQYRRDRPEGYHPPETGRDRAAFRRATLDVSNAGADYRQLRRTP